MIVYISGPMTGIPEFNFPEFNRVALALRRAGHTVLNPAETDNGDTSKCRSHYMRQDIAMLLRSEAVVTLDGWRNSRGAMLEVTIANELRLPILDEHLKPIDGESIGIEADRLVGGGRQHDYGHPYHDFSRTAALWSTMLGHKITPQQVALCMVLVKVSREVNKPKRDNRVDGAGYFQCLQLVHEYEQKNP